MIERVVEKLENVDPKASHFVEVEDTRLVLKTFVRGIEKTRRMLAATALPVGSYDVVGTTVVHRHDPATVIDELALYQQRLRMRSPEFTSIAKRLAKTLGGRLEEYMFDPATGPGHWAGYTIAVRKKTSWPKLQQQYRAVNAIVFPTRPFRDDGHGEIGITCADNFVDALTHWRGWNHRPLFQLIDKTCGIAALACVLSRSVELQLVRVAKKPTALIDALLEAGGDGEGARSAREWQKDLATKRLLLWWDY